MKQKILHTLRAWAILIAFMFLFRPEKLPVVVLIVPFVLLFVALYCSWNLFLMIQYRFYRKSETFVPKRRLGVAICISLVLLLVLQSLGQLTMKDVVTLVAIVILGYMYLARTRVGDVK